MSGVLGNFRFNLGFNFDNQDALKGISIIQNRLNKLKNKKLSIKGDKGALRDQKRLTRELRKQNKLLKDRQQQNRKLREVRRQRLLNNNQTNNKKPTRGLGAFPLGMAGKIGSALKGAVKGSTAFVAGALLAGNKINKNLTRINNLSKETGESTKSIEKLEFAFKSLGKTGEEADSFISNLSNIRKKALAGDYDKNLSTIGITGEQMKGSSFSILNNILSKINQAESPQQRALIIQKAQEGVGANLTGLAGQQGLLNQKFQEGASFSQDSFKVSKGINESMASLINSLKSFADVFMTSFGPSFIKIVKSLTSLLKNPVIQSGLKSLGETISSILDFIGNFATGFKKMIKGFTDFLMNSWIGRKFTGKSREDMIRENKELYPEEYKQIMADYKNRNQKKYDKMRETNVLKTAIKKVKIKDIKDLDNNTNKLINPLNIEKKQSSSKLAQDNILRGSTIINNTNFFTNNNTESISNMLKSEARGNYQ